MKNLMIITSVLLILFSTGCKDDVVVPAEKTSYDLTVRDLLGVAGTVTFTETSSTSTTIDIELTGIPSGSHPAELRSNTAIEGGTTAIVLNPVGPSGKSSTLTTAMTYNQLIAYDGFVQVHLSTTEPNTVIAIGDIGGNVITTTKVTYPLSTVGTFGVTGNALFEKRVNGNTLVTLTMNGLLPNVTYPATINIGSIATIGGGDIKKTLQNVDGNTGKSYTNISKLDNNVAISYANWLVYVGYINVYFTSANNLNIIAQGNIGAN
ncbi:MAG TPA: hypothetical protein P5084_09455 [Paludibacter sp.]|nr:hypothetical protein [Paludibacter sp.]